MVFEERKQISRSKIHIAQLKPPFNQDSATLIGFLCGFHLTTIKKTKARDHDALHF